MDSQEQVMGYNRLVAKAWSDPEFKARLLAEPEATLRTEGATVPAGMTVRILEPSEAHAFLGLPIEAPAHEATDAYSQVVRRALTDEAFRGRLKAEPAATLAEAGVEAPQATKLELVEATETRGYLFLPPSPDDFDINTVDDQVVGYFSSCDYVHPQPPPVPTFVNYGPPLPIHAAPAPAGWLTNNNPYSHKLW